MSIDKKAFGLSDSLVNAVNEALKGGQKKIDVAPPFGKLTGADFKKLRGEDAKPDYLDFDKDGNKKEPMKQALKQKNEVADGNAKNFKANMKEKVEVTEAEKKVPAGHYWSSYNGKVTKMHTPGTRVKTKHGVGVVKSAHSSMDWQDDNDSHYKVNVNGKIHDIHADDLLDKKMAPRRINVKEEIVSEAAAVGAPVPNMAAAMDARKAQVQRTIAQKQAAFQKAKANKRIAGTVKEAHKCSCGETNESKMKCEVHGGPRNRQMVKGGKEQIVMNPPLKEASDLPKKVVTKGHEIAKSLIKHRAKVKSPYAVGMATAKKSAGIKEEADLDEAAITGNVGHGYHGNVKADGDADRAKKYSAMHTKVKKLVGSAGHLKDARHPNKMVKHFLDSPHGRHIADDPSDRNITSRFGHFKKGYKPHMHEGVEQVDEVSAEVKKNNPLVFGDKKKSNPLVYGDKTKSNPLVYGDKKKSNPLVHREDTQIDELSKETMKSYVKAVDKRGESMKRGTGLNVASQKIAKQEPTSTLKKTVDAIKKKPHGKLKSSTVNKFFASHAELQRRGAKKD